MSPQPRLMLMSIRCRAGGWSSDHCVYLFEAEAVSVMCLQLFVDAWKASAGAFHLRVQVIVVCREARCQQVICLSRDI